MELIAKTPNKGMNVVANKDSLVSIVTLRWPLVKWTDLVTMVVLVLMGSLPMKMITNVSVPKVLLEQIVKPILTIVLSIHVSMEALVLISLMITNVIVCLDSLELIAKKMSMSVLSILVPTEVLVMIQSMISNVLVLQDSPEKIVPLKSTNVLAIHVWMVDSVLINAMPSSANACLTILANIATFCLMVQWCL